MPALTSDIAEPKKGFDGDRGAKSHEFDFRNFSVWTRTIVMLLEKAECGDRSCLSSKTCLQKDNKLWDFFFFLARLFALAF